jgi:hypothetical protein
MTKGDSLLDRIIAAHLAPDPPSNGHARELAAADPDALLDTVLDAVTQTYLPRRLCFTAPNGTAVRVDVANGRILGPHLSKPSPSGSGHGHDQDDPSESTDILPYLINLTANETSLTLTWERLDTTTNPANSAIMPFMTPASSQPDDVVTSLRIPAIFDFFHHIHTPTASLVIIRDGQITQSQGDTAPAFLAQAITIWNMAPVLETSPGSSLQIILLSSNDQTFLLARSDTHHLAALFDGEQAHVLRSKICELAANRPSCSDAD